MSTNRNRTSRDREHWYICGQCKLPQYAVVGEQAPVPCIDCGYSHRELEKYDIPETIKLEINKYA